MTGGLSSLLSEGLYLVSAALLLPTLLALTALLAATLLVCGGFAREWRERRAVRSGFRRALELLSGTDPQPDAVWRVLCGLPGGPGRSLTAGHSRVPSAEWLQKALGDVDTETGSRLHRLAFIARVGPMLGLMGTLIPFGPALMGLSGGNVQELSSNLVTAFASTVVGLLCSCLAFGIGAVRRGWYARDFGDLEFVVGRLAARENRGADTQETELADGRGRPHRRTGQPV
jgi:biopolymer transport protein ExbB/TolQ